MSDALRIYDPAECDAAGIPLDWERCRTCDGARGVEEAYDCPACGGCGSLREAALAHFRGDEAAWGGRMRLGCEGCGHPMSDGTWEAADPEFVAWAGAADATRHGEAELRAGREPDGQYTDTPWSPCDEGCRHEGPGRVKLGQEWMAADRLVRASNGGLNYVLNGTPVEASWRQVDVRTLGWAHDLRPEKLAVLCLRCVAGRRG